MIPPINYVADWRYIRQRKQTKINKYADRENTTRIDHNYRVGDKFMTNMSSVYKYETPFRGPYETFRTWTNQTVALQTGVVTKIIDIQNIKPYNDLDLE